MYSPSQTYTPGEDRSLTGLSVRAQPLSNNSITIKLFRHRNEPQEVRLKSNNKNYALAG